MAPPTPGRIRGPRPQVNNNIGEAGRTTNIAAPKGVPRDSAGHEKPDAFFDRAAAAGSGDDYDDNGDDDYDNDRRDADDDFDAPEPAASSARKASAKKKKAGGANGAAAAARGARGERPDRFMLGEDRGRKTGVKKAVVARDPDGFEDINEFLFTSPAQSTTTATSGARSTVKKATKASQGRTPRAALSPEYDDNDDDERAESDMMGDDDGPSLSPSTYQRRHPSTSSARQPSALRHSMLPSGARSVSRKGLTAPGLASPGSSPRRYGKASASGSGSAQRNPRRRLSSLSGDDDRGQEEVDEDEEERFDVRSEGEGEGYDDDDGAGEGDGEDETEDEDEDEAVRAVLTAKKPSASALAKGKGKARASTSTTNGGAGSPSSPRRQSGASSYGAGSPGGGTPTGLMRLDKNGRAVEVVERSGGSSGAGDRKGKGRAVERSLSPVERDERGDDEQQPFLENEYGGGYDDDEGQVSGSDDEGGAGAGAGRGGSDDGLEPIEVEEEEEEDDHRTPRAAAGPSKAKGKGKGRAPRSSASGSSPDKAVTQRGRKGEVRPREIIEDVSKKRRRGGDGEHAEGVRRSNREKIPRLDYWRNERIIYKRRSSGIGVNAIVRVPKEDPEPLGGAHGKKKGGAGGKRGASARAGSRGGTVKREVPEEQGVDDMTDPDGLVWSWEGDAEVSRRIAFTDKMMDPRPTFDKKFSYQKIYQELDYLAGGILTIPPNGEKALKPSKDNSYIFYCIQGSVSVTIHRTVFSIGPGGTFFVPRGNQYQIQATSNREVRLFFSQGRRVIEYEDGSTRADTKEDSQRANRANNREEEGEEEREEEEEEGDE
ncbi:hypothetical protein JCM3775_002922 [Rhodotorula graminis]